MEYYGIDYDYSLIYALSTTENKPEEIVCKLRLKFLCFDDITNPYENFFHIDIEVLGEDHYDNILLWKNNIDGQIKKEYRRKTSVSDFYKYFIPYRKESTKNYTTNKMAIELELELKEENIF